VVVKVEDTNGNLVTGSTASITISSTPAGVGGTTTVAAVGGIATFSNLVFSTTGSYTLTAASSGLTSATSNAIIIASSGGTPAIVLVSPGFGLRTQSIQVTITAQNTHFQQGVTTANFGPGIAVGGGTSGSFGAVTVTSATTATAQLTIAANAAFGPRTVSARTGTEQATLINGFSVNGNPIILYVSPNYAKPGTSVTVNIYGQFTNFVQGTSVANFGAGISVGGAAAGANGPITVTSPTTATAQLTISSGATLGVRVPITVTTGAEVASWTSPGFFVLSNVTGSAPTVTINSPMEGSEVTALTTVTGTVVSPNLAYWTLSYQGSGSTIFTQFATGTTGTVSGMFDPTMLLNGMAQIQLSATDQSGQTSTTVVDVVVTRNVKIGNFTLAFTDLNIPVAGIPIQVIRTYDSRIKASGDFGFGWSLSYNTVKVESNGLVGDNWAVTTSGGLLPDYCIVYQGSVVVSVRLQDGTVYQFQPAATSATQCQQIQPPQTVDLTFVPISTTPANASLSAPAGAGLFVSYLGGLPGPVQLLDSSTFTSFDPTQFFLKLPTGQQLSLDKVAGLTSVTDTNGNTLTFSASGIVSSPGGKSVTFARDAQNRITTITDPAGNTLKYAYSANGDLATSTNQLSNVSTFTYDGNHDLLSYQDPSGNQPIRSVYDDSGRLIQVIDAFGHVTNINHDVGASTETVTDALGYTTTYAYDANGNVVQITDPLGNTTSSTYDARGNKTSQTDALGRITKTTFDANNNRLSIANPAGETFSFTYNSQNLPLTFADAKGNTTTNTYDPSGNLLTSANALGKATSRTYNASGLPVTVTDLNGNKASLAYDASGNMTSLTDVSGVTTTYTYDANNNRLSQTVTRTTSSGSQTLTTQYQYDAMNRLVKTTLPDGSSTQTVYNSIGKPTETVDELGRQTSYVYDQAGRLILTTHPDGTTESNTYDADGRIILFTGRNGAVKQYTYDGLGRNLVTIDSLGGTTTTAYDAVGQILSINDPRGNTSQYAYDSAGRKTKITDSLNNSMSFAYDTTGRLISNTDANGHTTSFQYDALGRRTKITFADGSAQTYVYDAFGHNTSTTDAAGKTTQVGYDSLGRLVSVTEANGHTTTYTYDEVGNRITQTDANGHITKLQYDQRGHLTARILPAGQAENFTYDLAGNLASHTDFIGKNTVYAYDSGNRLLTKTPDSSFHEPPVSYTYTTTGKRASMTDLSGTTTYAYDSVDRLISKQTPQGTISYAYDLNGNVTQIQSAGYSVNYTYDPVNRLSSVSEASTGNTNYAYDSAGNLQDVTCPNGVSHSYSYDSRNRLTQLEVAKGSTNLAGYTYTVDGVGHRLSVTESTGRSVNYVYDNAYRLTSETIAGDVSGQNGTASYTYDSVGNRLQLASTIPALPGGLLSYDANDRLTGVSYDANGNTLSSGGMSNSYDFENRLIQHGNVTILYDGDGNRVSKTVGGVTTKYLIDDVNPTGFAQVLIETASDGSSRTYVYGLERISQKRFDPHTSTTQISFYLYDGHNSVRSLTDPTGAVTDSYEYDAFGNVVHSSGSTPNNYLFSGEQFDPDLGLYFLRARYLDTASGRFLTMDPMFGSPEDPVSLHRYLYAGDDPVNRVDPSGMQDLIDVAITGAIIGTLAGATIGFIGGGLPGAFKGAAFGFLGGLLLPVLAAVATATLIWAGVGVSTALFIPLATFTLIGTLLGVHALETATTTRQKVAAVLSIVLALVSFGLGSYAILGAPQPITPNFAADVTLSGHGGWNVSDGFITVPEGTSVTLPTSLGNTISDSYGGALESGGDLTPYLADTDGALTYPAGSRIPNLTLYPPDGLSIQGSPTTVSTPTTLGGLIGAGQGNVLWSACCVISPQ
jgi:RHS repeat-associated protein